MIKVVDWKFNLAGADMIKLENGALLHESEYNGEVYTVKEGLPGQAVEVAYKPVWQGIGEPDEDGDYERYEIIGFDRLP